jgi:hypothetical protein
VVGWIDDIKRWARELKREIFAVWIAARDPRTPVAAKVVGGIIAAYAISPIDLIPDFIPWSASIGWSSLNVNAWSAFGLSGRCFLALAGGNPKRCVA